MRFTQVFAGLLLTTGLMVQAQSNQRPNGWVLTTPVPAFTIRVVAKDSTGAVIPGTSVTAANVETLVSDHSVTDETGGHQFTSLTEGRYVVSAALSGFRTSYREVEITGRAGVQVEFEMKVKSTGECPGYCEGPAPIPATRVLRATFDNERSLELWIQTIESESAVGLNNLGTQPTGLRLTSIIPIEDGTSLFVFEGGLIHLATDASPLLIRVKEPLDAERLAARAGLFPERRFIGVHRLSASAYLLVVR
jgi:hypothetical protein